MIKLLFILISAIISVHADSIAIERCSSSVVAIYGDTSASVSSGVVLDKNGYILTNHHIVAGEEALSVILENNQEFNATVIAYDKETDIALIKIIDSKSLHSATISKLFPKRGDEVYAVGYPLQTHQSVSKGIVSATHVYNLGIYSYQSFIESDLNVARGNSGGALCNSKGELIALNSAVRQGFTFSIEIDKALKIANILKEKDKFERGSLGISVDKAPSCRGTIVTNAKKHQF